MQKFFRNTSPNLFSKSVFIVDSVRLPAQTIDKINKCMFLFLYSGCKVHYSSRDSFRLAACMP